MCSKAEGEYAILTKNELRTELKKLRAAMSFHEVTKKSNAICNAISALPVFESANTVMVYLSFKNEADTRGIISEALRRGKTVLVPSVNGDEILPCVLGEHCSLRKGSFGIDEPQSREIWQSAIDLCIVPGLGFDLRGGRIGFGKGYYDRFLKKHTCKKLGAAYSCQIRDNVFAEEHDIPMDIIVTERECIFCE